MATPGQATREQSTALGVAVLNRRQQELRQQRIPKVSDKEGERFRRDAKREERRGIRGFVVCRECFSKFRKIQANHLRLHGLTCKQYEQKWKDSKGDVPSLMCTAMRTEVSGRSFDQQRNQRGRPRLNLKVRGHDTAALKWPMLCLAVEGKSCKAIAKEVDRFFTTVWADLAALGFSGRAAFHDLGERWMAANVLQLKTATGLSVAELSERAGLPDAFKDAVWRPRTRFNPALVRKLVAWRDNVLRALLVPDSRRSRGVERLNRSEVLKTFLPNLRARHKLLRAALSKMRAFLRVYPDAGAEELKTYLCEQAMLEVSGESSGDVFKRFLPWAPQLMPFLGKNIDRLRRHDGHLWPLAWEALGARWDASPKLVEAAIRARTRRIAPREMRFLILGLSDRSHTPAAFSLPPAAPAARPLRKKPEPRPYERTESFRVGKSVEAALPRFEAICADLRSLRGSARSRGLRMQVVLSAHQCSSNEIQAVKQGRNNPLRAARYFISFETKYQYETVAQYHKEFKAHSGVAARAPSSNS